MSKQETNTEKTESKVLLTSSVSSSNFIIKQISEKEFIILKKFKEKTTKGYLWWKRTIIKEEYRRIDRYGYKFFMITYPIYFTNLDKLDTYKSKEEAKRWIDNYNKYPINYYC